MADAYIGLLKLLAGLKPGYMLLVQACIIILVPYLLWRVMGLGKYFPLGVIQICTGVLLGPAVFGALAPDLFKTLFNVAPKYIVDAVSADKVAKGLGQFTGFGNRAAAIGALATIAVCLFGFLAGAEANKDVIRKSGKTLFSIGVYGMLFGWGLAIVGGYFIYTLFPVARGPEATPLAFAIGYGLIIAVSALPVLLLILRALDVIRKRLGAIALGSAGIADTMMWAGLGIVVALTSAKSSGLTAAIIQLLAGGLLSYGFIAYVASPMLNKLLREKAPEAAIMTLTAFSIFVASAITAITELHPVLGAFVAGMFLPDDVREMALHRLDQATTLVLMPFFFLNTGLNTQFSFADINIWLLTIISTFLCFFGKMVGHGVAARMAGEKVPFAMSIGLLLQTKGLMGLIVLLVFREIGLISDTMFSAGVLMCILSTALTKIFVQVLIDKYGDEATGPVSKPAEAELRHDAGTAAVTIPPIATSKPVLARLEFGQGQEPIAITSPSVQIGRHSSDDVRINDVRVSRNHALLKQRLDGRFELTNQTADRAVANPIHVNGEYREQAEIKDGDRIDLGGVEFVFRQAAA
ncbi:MAG: hypothetical protein RL291_2113 [Pseudomonadota bacterium]